MISLEFYLNDFFTFYYRRIDEPDRLKHLGRIICIHDCILNFIFYINYRTIVN